MSPGVNGTPRFGTTQSATGLAGFRRRATRCVACAIATFAASADADHDVPLLPSASDPDRSGFVRIINHAARSGSVRLVAIDDDGNPVGPRELSIGAREALHFNSDDLESGNPTKGIDPGTGAGSGDWRLELDSDLDIEVLAYIRTPSGFLASMHEVVDADDDGRHHLDLVNPAGDVGASSLLRIVNSGEEAVDVTIRGRDDTGAESGEVLVTVPAGAARTLTAEQLESGAMFDGSLGSGTGRWRLSVSADDPITVMNLMESPSRQLVSVAGASSKPGESGTHHVPLFAGTSHGSARVGVVRLINGSDRAGSVSIDASDESDTDYEPVELTLAANEAVTFEADDLENGNTDLGLSGGIGPGTGDWRLSLSSDLDIAAASYARNESDGFLTPMHTVAGPGTRHGVAIFNPGSNGVQVSRLRLENPGSGPAEVTIAGVDDHGMSPGPGVRVSVPAGRIRTLTAPELETGGDALEGELGDGAGKWRLAIESDAPIRVMNLLTSPTGHLVSLATVPTNFAPANASAFDDRAVGQRLVEAGGDSYIDFIAGGRYREFRGGQTTTGSYVYANTGAAAASVELDPDDGDPCTTELTFESRMAGGIAPCDATGISPWQFLVPSRPGNGGVSHAITALIETLPSGTWTPDVVRDAEVSVANGAVRIEFAGGGYVEAGGFRYTCWGADGCVIDDATVLSGRILETPAAPVRDFELIEDNADSNGIAHADGNFYVVDSGDRTVYAYDRAGRHLPDSTFSLAATTHTAAGIAFGDDRFYVVDELDILEDDPRRVYVYDSLGAHLEDADFELRAALKDPLGIAFAGGRLYIADARTRRVYAYSTQGEREREADFRLHADNASPRGIAYGDGRFHVVDIFEDKVYVYREDGQRDPDRDFDLAGVNGFAQGIEVVDGAFYVADSRRVFVYPTDRPDLVVDAISVNDARPGPGETISLRVTVRNVGHRRSAPTALRYHRSTDAFIGTGDELIGEGEVAAIPVATARRATGNIEVPTASGRYYYGACVAALPDELDIANCSRHVQVTVPIDLGGATEGFILDPRNGKATGMAFADDRFFVLDAEDHKVYAYRTNAERDPDRDFALDVDNRGAEAIVHEDGKFYVIDRFDDKVYVYSTAGVRDADADFDLDDDNTNPNGIAFGNDRFYVVDLSDDRIYAYKVSGERDRTAGFPLSQFNDTPWAMEFVDDRLYVIDNVNDRVYVYDLDGERDTALEFVLDFDNASPESITLADDRRFYVVDHFDDKVYGYPGPAIEDQMAGR